MARPATVPDRGNGRRGKQRPAARTTIAVQGARVHNLKNISVEIPRDQLIVVTGLSGSGKSSLAFDTIYAEGQRRYLRVTVELRQAICCPGHKAGRGLRLRPLPRDLDRAEDDRQQPPLDGRDDDRHSGYLNLLYATIGEPHCPRTGEPTPSRSASQILEAILSLPAGTEVELRAPVFKLYGEELDVVLTEVRKKGCRRLIIDGKEVDISSEVELDESSVRDMDAVVDRLVVGRKHEKAIKAGIAATLLVGDGLMQIQVVKAATRADAERFYRATCSETHHFVYGDIQPDWFVFNNPESACRTCGGLGVQKMTHPELLIPDPTRSIRGGCFVREAFRYNPDTWDGRVMYSLSKDLGFSLDEPWEKLPDSVRETILFGLDSRKIPVSLPPDGKVTREDFVGHEVGFGGIARRIERHYRRYRQRGEASSGMEAWLEKVMVEHTCPDCKGARVRADSAPVHDRREDGPRRRPAPLRPAPRIPWNDQADAAAAPTPVAGRAGDPRAARAAARHWTRLPELQSAVGDALRGRVAADPALHADRVGLDGDAVRPRRAEHWAASQGQREDDRDAGEPARHRATRSSSSSTTRTRSALPDHLVAMGPGPGVHGGRES